MIYNYVISIDQLVTTILNSKGKGVCLQSRYPRKQVLRTLHYLPPGIGTHSFCFLNWAAKCVPNGGTACIHDVICCACF